VSEGSNKRGLPQVDELKRRAAQLDSDVRDLNNTTEANTAALDRIHERLDRSDKDRRRFITALIALAMLAGFLGVEAVRLEQAIRAQNQLRGEVLCPLYGIFLGAYDPASRDNNPDPQAREKYEDAYQKIRGGWQVMQCTDPVVPPRSDTSR
jgi:hypothetical protein